MREGRLGKKYKLLIQNLRMLFLPLKRKPLNNYDLLFVLKMLIDSFFRLKFRSTTREDHVTNT